MKSLRNFACLLFLFACVSDCAPGGVVRLEWEAVVTGTAFTPPPSVTVGSSIRGSFTYDDSDTGSFFTPTIRRYQPPGSYQIELPGVPVFQGNTVSANVSDNDQVGTTTLDALSFNGLTNNVGDYGFTIAFRDFDAVTVDTLALPSEDVFDSSFLSNQEFQQLTISFRSQPAVVQANLITGRFTSFSVASIPSPVPEPGTWLCFSVLGLVGLRRRKRRHA